MASVKEEVKRNNFLHQSALSSEIQSNSMFWGGHWQPCEKVLFPNRILCPESLWQQSKMLVKAPLRLEPRLHITSCCSCRKGLNFANAAPVWCRAETCDNPQVASGQRDSSTKVAVVVVVDVVVVADVASGGYILMSLSLSSASSNLLSPQRATFERCKTSCFLCFSATEIETGHKKTTVHLLQTAERRMFPEIRNV